MRRIRIDRSHPSTLLSASEGGSEAHDEACLPGWALYPIRLSEPLTEDCGASDERLLALDADINRLVLSDDGNLSRCRCIPCYRERSMSADFDPVYLPNPDRFGAWLLVGIVAMILFSVLSWM